MDLKDNLGTIVCFGFLWFGFKQYGAILWAILKILVPVSFRPKLTIDGVVNFNHLIHSLLQVSRTKNPEVTSYSFIEPSYESDP